MISHNSIPEQLVPGTSTATDHRNSLMALALRMAFNFKRWLRNRRDLRNLNDDQLRDVGLSREAVEQACWLYLLRQ